MRREDLAEGSDEDEANEDEANDEDEANEFAMCRDSN